MSGRQQKGPCCFETRGGIEDYCAAATSALAPGGRFVVCAGVQGQRSNRSEDAAAAAGLAILRQLRVIPRGGKPPLMDVFVMARASEVRESESATAAAAVYEEFTVRAADGSLTAQMLEARTFMGFPPPRQSEQIISDDM